MTKAAKAAQELIDRIDMPEDVCLGATKITICGRRNMLIENHRGIISYGDELIEVDCGEGTVRVRGDALRLGAMDRRDMLISGRLLVVELE